MLNILLRNVIRPLETYMERDTNFLQRPYWRGNDLPFVRKMASIEIIDYRAYPFTLTGDPVQAEPGGVRPMSEVS
jgi:hypothetical protein